MRRTLVVLLAACLLAGEAHAWPESLFRPLLRDARRMVPRSLSGLIMEREEEVLEAIRRFPPELTQAMARDLSAGALHPDTITALDGQAALALEAFKARRVSEGVVVLAATMRVPMDLSDPALTIGPAGYPAGVVREYYAFLEANLSKIPVVLADEKALKLRRGDLPAYWRALLAGSRRQSEVLAGEMIRQGQVVSHRLIDFRSPVFAVASLSYSRATTAIAATWIAIWQDARGDLTRPAKPKLVVPSERPVPVPGTVPTASPRQEGPRP
jgi:hypothetical protein